MNSRNEIRNCFWTHLFVFSDPHLCELPHTAGPKQCRAMMRIFHYNADKGECENDIYGGCGATLNNFPTLEDCQKACGDYKRPEWVTA